MRGKESERAEFSLSLWGHFNVTLDSVKIPVTLQVTAERGRRRKLLFLLLPLSARRRRSSRRGERRRGRGVDAISLLFFYSMILPGNSLRHEKKPKFSLTPFLQNTRKQPLVMSQGVISAGDIKSDLNSSGEDQVSIRTVCPVFAVCTKTINSDVLLHT